MGKGARQGEETPTEAAAGPINAPCAPPAPGSRGACAEAPGCPAAGSRESAAPPCTGPGRAAAGWSSCLVEGEQVRHSPGRDVVEVGQEKGGAPSLPQANCRRRQIAVAGKLGPRSHVPSLPRLDLRVALVEVKEELVGHLRQGARGMLPRHLNGLEPFALRGQGKRVTVKGVSAAFVTACRGPHQPTASLQGARTPPAGLLPFFPGARFGQEARRHFQRATPEKTGNAQAEGRAARPRAAQLWPCSLRRLCQAPRASAPPAAARATGTGQRRS